MSIAALGSGMRIRASRAGALLFALVQVMTWTIATPAQAVVLAPTATVSLAPHIVLRGEATTVTVTLTNPNAAPLSSVTDAPTMPAGVTPLAVATNTCGGSVAINAISGGAATLSGGALAANASCSFAFTATAAAAGTIAIPTGSPSGAGTAAGVAGTPAILTVNQPPGPNTSIVLSAPSIYTGGVTTFTATVTNPNNAPLSGVYNTVYSAPGTSFVVTLGTSSCTNGGSPGVLSVSSTSYTSNFTIAANSSCLFTGKLTSSTPGTYLIYPGTAYATGSTPGTAGSAVTLTVNPILPPTATVSLSPTSIASGGVSLATVTLTNPNSVALTGVGDSVLAPIYTTINNVTPGGTCIGTSTPTPNTFTLAGATLAANASCTFSYQITSNTLGSHPISPGLSSATSAVVGGIGAPAYLKVGLIGTPPVAPTTSIVLSKSSIYTGGTTIMTATVTNPNNVPLSGVYNIVYSAPGTSFVVSLGTSSCTNGGSPGVISVSSTSYTSNFTIAANSSCLFTGTLTSTIPGSYLIYPGTAFATGSAPGTPGSAVTLTVNSILPPTATVSLSPTSIASGGVSLATVTLTNPNSVALTGVGDSVDAPLYTTFIVATPGGTCNGTSTPTPNTFTLAGATLAANASCTFSYQVTTSTLGSHPISPGLSSATSAVVGGIGAPAYLVVGINQSVAFQSSAPLLNTVGGTYTPVATATSGLPVTISVDATSSAVCAIASGVVTFITPGSCVLNANQAGNGTFNAASQVQQSLTVGMAGTTTTITTHTPNPSVVGTPIVVSVSVGVVAPGGGSPTGTVTVSDGSSNCFFSLPTTSCNLTPSSIGSKTLTASYTGNANYIASSSGGVGHTVTLPPGSVTLFTSSNPSIFGSPVTFTAVITGNTPLGTVNFKDGGVSISGCSAQAVTSGQASCVTNTLSLGNHNITADYSGDGQYPPSTTGGFVQKVIANIVPMLMLLLD